MKNLSKFTIKINNMSKAKKNMIACAVFAFLSFISFIQRNAFFFDSRGINWIPTAGGIVFGLTAIYFLYLVIKTAGTSRHQ
jgi:hypothetical protein